MPDNTNRQIEEEKLQEELKAAQEKERNASTQKKKSDEEEDEKKKSSGASFDKHNLARLGFCMGSVIFLGPLGLVVAGVAILSSTALCGKNSEYGPLFVPVKSLGGFAWNGAKLTGKGAKLGYDMLNLEHYVVDPIVKNVFKPAGEKIKETAIDIKNKVKDKVLGLASKAKDAVVSAFDDEEKDTQPTKTSSNSTKNSRAERVRKNDQPQPSVGNLKPPITPSKASDSKQARVRS
jgi:hypothetical protein